MKSIPSKPCNTSYKPFIPHSSLRAHGIEGVGGHALDRQIVAQQGRKVCLHEFPLLLLGEESFVVLPVVPVAGTQARELIQLRG